MAVKVESSVDVCPHGTSRLQPNGLDHDTGPMELHQDLSGSHQCGGQTGHWPPPQQCSRHSGDQWAPWQTDTWRRPWQPLISPSGWHHPPEPAHPELSRTPVYNGGNVLPMLQPARRSLERGVDCCRPGAAAPLDRRRVSVGDGVLVGVGEMTSPDSCQFVNIVLLGASGVGKTSIIQQLVWGRSPGQFKPTVERETYYPSLVVGGKLTRVKIVDSPLLPYFPVYSAYNIRDLQLASVNSAQAYLLVFDLGRPETFEYLVSLHGQMEEAWQKGRARGLCVVVANKSDLQVEQHKKNEMLSKVKSWNVDCLECTALSEDSVLHLFKDIMLRLNQQAQRPAAFMANDESGRAGSKCAIL